MTTSSPTTDATAPTTPAVQRAATVPLAHIRVHPKNPRRKAVADDPLVDSVREGGIRQPIIVAVDLDHHNMTAPADLREAVDRDPSLLSTLRFIAIDGHRRRDAATRAGLTDVPVVIQADLDTEAAQVQAMLVANAHHEDFTPIEEAEGYQQLLDLDYRQADVAKALGRKPREVSRSLKLLKLPKPTQTKIHSGQLTLDDAHGLVEFADDTDVLKRLEKAAASSSDFRYQLTRARQHRDADQQVAAEAADLEQAGAKRLDHDTYMESGARALYATPLQDPTDHDGCLAFAVAAATDYFPSRLVLLCTDPDSHEGQLSAEDQQRRAEADERRAEDDARLAATTAARENRLRLAEQRYSGDLKVPGVLADLLRATLPALVDETAGRYFSTARTVTYERLARIPEGATWSDKHGDARNTAIADHLADLEHMSGNGLARCLAAATVAIADEAFAASAHRHDYHRNARPYAALLDALGHDFGGPDADIRAALTGDDTTDTSGAVS